MYSDTPGSQTASGKLLEAGCGPCSATSNKIKSKTFRQNRKHTNKHILVTWRTMKTKSNDFPFIFPLSVFTAIKLLTFFFSQNVHEFTLANYASGENENEINQKNK